MEPLDQIISQLWKKGQMSETQKIQVDLTDKEIEMITIALNMRSNWIETDNVLVSAEDVRESGPSMRDKRTKIQVLSEEQMKLVISSKDLVERLQKKRTWESLDW